ncbi:hypothetical protein VTJ04DRAFT_3648 [Mycothermus thermophilus]|uniref:uncharacterized protein n=1 Tax=Humicola insolens TaxID=85995 RepID=UPI003743D1BC
MSRRSRQLWWWARPIIFLTIVWLLLLSLRHDSTTALFRDHDAAVDNPIALQCRAHGWKPFIPSKPSQPRRVYDLLLINTELDQLEIRLNTTFSEVDYYILVEAARTFTYRPKPLTLRENLSRFDAYKSKLIYHELEFPPDYAPTTTWQTETLQRNAMLTQAIPKLAGTPRAPRPGDVLVVSDVDEIPRPSTLALLRACAFPRRLTLYSRFYYYSFQWLHRGDEWPHPQATYFEGDKKTLLPDELRMGIGGSGVWPFKQLRRWWEAGALRNASWHCSSCFATIRELVNKMGSFSHVGLNKERFRDPEHIVDRVRNGKDLWDRKGEFYDRIENNEDVPEFLKHNRDRFGYMLDRDGPGAGFLDYQPGM